MFLNNSEYERSVDIPFTKWRETVHTLTSFYFHFVGELNASSIYDAGEHDIRISGTDIALNFIHNERWSIKVLTTK